MTPPTIPVFLVAVILAVLAVGDIYTHVPGIHAFLATHRFGIVVTAFAILVVGVVFPGL